MRCRRLGWGLRAGTGALLWLAVAIGCASEPPPPHVVELREAEEALAVGEAESALERFQRAHELVPNHPDVLRGLALAELRLGRPGAALGWFDQLEQVRAGAFDAELTVARCAALLAAVTDELGRQAWAQALALAEQTPAAAVCRSDQLSRLAIRAHMAEAVQAREANQLASAVDHLEWVLAEQPGHADATLASVDLLLRDGSRDDALRLLSEALAHHPKDARLIEATVDLLAEP
jgi:tetratricopeptide (TPR) repeat protein